MRIAAAAVAAAALASWAAHGWLTATTRRLYLESRAEDGAATSGSWSQGFVIRDGRVVPQLAAEGKGTLRFRRVARRAGVVKVEGSRLGPATLAVAAETRGGRRVATPAPAGFDGGSTFAIPFEAGEVTVELQHDGRVAWSDPRLEEGSGAAIPALLALAALALLGRWLPQASPATRRRAYGALVAAGTTLACWGLLEAVLRRAGPRIPAGLGLARAGIGDPAGDPGWTESARYVRRHTPGHRRAITAAHGDITLMGIVPADAAAGVERSHDFVADDEGFRNPAVRARIHVAALGDSFTDGMMVPQEETWPARLEAILGRPVQNYGTAGFAAPQEALALEEFALPRRPKVVVVAHFVGNDIPEADGYAQWKAGRIVALPRGWRIQADVARYETLFAWSIAAVWPRMGVLGGGDGRGAVPEPVRERAAPSFDRGVFALRMGGRTVEAALMPRTLRRLALSRERIEGEPGWAPTVEAVRRMRDVSAGAGAAFLMVVIPSRCQVFLPALEAAFGRDALRAQLAAYFPGEPGAVDLEAWRAHRTAANEALAAMGAREGIALLDLTAPLEAALARGESPYFADDTHWNGAGHRVAAEAIAAELRARGWDRE